MAYTAAALARRRCSHIFPEGHPREGWPCEAFARWDSPGALDGTGLCTAHAGRVRGRDRTRDERRSGEGYECRTVPKCRCRAYPFPHRPGGGLCRWPDAPLRELQPRSSWGRLRMPGRGFRGYVAPAVTHAPDLPSPGGHATPTVSGAVNPAATSGTMASLVASLQRLSGLGNAQKKEG
jgi:hypothetical protein